jgi:predicted HAD superfamily Cof-like phosphohydrolase
MLKQIMADSTNQTQEQVRKMLMQMIALVPGQLFRDIELFHKKFGLEPTKDPGHRLDPEMLKFRIKFMAEELNEYCQAVGQSVRNVDADKATGAGLNWAPINPDFFDAEEAFDALVDLAYVCLGTAYLHRFDFNSGWARVQEKNMQKVRAARPEDSKRGSGFDVVKPEGWTPPILTDLLDEECGACHGVGDHGDLSIEPVICGKCCGKGTVKRARPSGDGQQG